MGKIFSSCSSDRELIPRLYKVPKKVKGTKPSNTVNKWTGDPKWYSS
jgi:hypothetical protein